MTSQRGKHLRARDVLQIVVVSGDESVAKRWRDENARRKVGGFEYVKTIAVSERVGVEEGQKRRFQELGLAPFVEGGGNRGG